MPPSGCPRSTALWCGCPSRGAELPLPPGAQLLHGSADLPGARFLDLVATMDRLRVECPWDARQTHASLAPHLLEEPYEALEALESGDEQAFCEELGDVLLQVVFHARIAAERADGTSFTVDDVADGIPAKLVRRHPHVSATRPSSGPGTWSSATGTTSSGKRSGPRRRGAGSPPTEPSRPRRSTGCRSASPRWPWPLSCNAGPNGPAFPRNWPIWTATPAQLPRGDLGLDLFRLVAKARAEGLRPWDRAARRSGPLPRHRARLGAVPFLGSGWQNPDVFLPFRWMIRNTPVTTWR